MLATASVAAAMEDPSIQVSSHQRASTTLERVQTQQRGMTLTQR